jgi:hypothetical protein
MGIGFQYIVHEWTFYFYFYFFTKNEQILRLYSQAVIH